MTPRPLVNWQAVSNTVKRTVPIYTKSQFVKVKHYAEWMDNHPELVCNDLKNVPTKTLRFRISIAMREHLKWRIYSKGHGTSPVYVVPERG